MASSLLSVYRILPSRKNENVGYVTDIKTSLRGQVLCNPNSLRRQTATRHGSRLVVSSLLGRRVKSRETVIPDPDYRIPVVLLGIVASNSVDQKAFQIIQTCQNSKARNLQSFEIKASTDNNQSTTKTKSIVCSNCEGNGAIACNQCKGSGVNSEDHFNGRFKAGGLCWLCRGKKQVLCGECNGAGFLGGFLSTFDD